MFIVFLLLDFLHKYPVHLSNISIKKMFIYNLFPRDSLLRLIYSQSNIFQTNILIELRSIIIAKKILIRNENWLRIFFNCLLCANMKLCPPFNEFKARPYTLPVEQLVTLPITFFFSIVQLAQLFFFVSFFNDQFSSQFCFSFAFVARSSSNRAWIIAGDFSLRLSFVALNGL